MNRMKTVLMTAAMLVCVFACTAVAGKTVYAAPNDTIQTGISADGMDLSGMTQEQAQGAVQSFPAEDYPLCANISKFRFRRIGRWRMRGQRIFYMKNYWSFMEQARTGRRLLSRFR